MPERSTDFAFEPLAAAVFTLAVAAGAMMATMFHARTIRADRAERDIYLLLGGVLAAKTATLGAKADAPKP